VLSLAGKVALVTGAGSVGPGWGNGKATATLLARQGAAVFGVDIVADAAEETRRIIEDEGGICLVRRCDMTRAEEVRTAVAACVDRFGRIDVLVNNVGGSQPGGPVELTEEAWNGQLDLNLRSAFLGCKFVLPVMERQGSGAIVNLSSVAGIREHVGRAHAGYSASKAAIIGLSRSIAIRHARSGVRCNTVIPGLMHTPLVEARLAGQLAGGDAEALVAARHAAVPVGHMGDAWDVAHAVLFLASDEARYVTATEIVVDGGLSAVSPSPVMP
jgi:NAD(P)-dependent dehydrogenase (short-subunit alcohol dehydrogenase family)